MESRECCWMRCNVARDLSWALLIALSVSFAPDASAQYDNAQVLHVDMDANTVLLSFWEGIDDFAGPAHLYRATTRLWNGRVPPVIRDGLTYRGRFLFGHNPAPWTEFDLGYEVAGIFNQDYSGEFELYFDDLVPVGNTCDGAWKWHRVKAECVKGSPQTNPLSVAWRAWTDREKLTVLVYLYHNHAIGWPAFQSCAAAKGPETRHRCQQDYSAEYLDPIVTVAHNVNPLPSIPAEAIERSYYAKDQLAAVKSTADLWSVIQAYDRVVEAAPWWPDAYQNRARVEAVYGLYLWAIADYERVLKLNPSPETAADVREKIAELQR